MLYARCTVHVACQAPTNVNPLCFMDLHIGNSHAGRLVFELFVDIVPRTCANFHALYDHRHRPDYPLWLGKSSSVVSQVHGNHCRPCSRVPASPVAQPWQPRCQWQRACHVFTAFCWCTVGLRVLGSQIMVQPCDTSSLRRKHPHDTPSRCCSSRQGSFAPDRPLLVKAGISPIGWH